MFAKKLIPAIFVGVMALTAAPSFAADVNQDVWTSIANMTMMKEDMKMMKEAMEMMKKAEATKDTEMAKKAIEMMKHYIKDYETIFGGRAG